MASRRGRCRRRGGRYRGPHRGAFWQLPPGRVPIDRGRDNAVDDRVISQARRPSREGRTVVLTSVRQPHHSVTEPKVARGSRLGDGRALSGEGELRLEVARRVKGQHAGESLHVVDDRLVPSALAGVDAARRGCDPCRRFRPRDQKRGKPVVALAGTRTVEAIVPATKPDDRYPVCRSRDRRDVAASRCRQRDRAPTDARVSDGRIGAAAPRDGPIGPWHPRRRTVHS